MDREQVIDCIKNDNFKTEDGLNYDVFLFASSITPLVNVDLLVEDEQGRILLAWRDDVHCGTGWHIPGGIVRYKETLFSRLHKTAITEFGVDVEVLSDSPIKLTEIIHEQEERGHFISLLYRCKCSIQLLGTIVTAVCFLVVHTFSSFFESFFGMDSVYINIMFLYMLVYPSFTLLQTKHRQLMKYKAVTIITFVSTIATVITSVLLVFCMENDFLARVLGNTVVMFALCIIVYGYNIYLGKGTVKLEYWRYALAISVPMIPHLLAGNILGTSDRIMITQFCGSESTALYSVIYSCSLIVMLLFQSINQAWTPWFYEQLAAGNHKTISKASKVYIFCAAFVLVAIMLIGPEIVLIFGGASYSESASIMPPIMLGCFYWCLYTFFVNTEIYYKKTFTISAITIVGAVANLILNYVFIQLFGWQAAAYTTLFGYFLLFVLHSIRGKRLGTNDYYTRKFFYGMAIVSFALMLVIRMLYNYFIIRLLIFSLMAIVILAFLLKNYKKFKSILRR
ncbi:MAG: oligosaccharide flippase family protein [Clostridiales bacterium]|nr:oligosaccharide flippase family protein [Clostridiales bacterium]